MAKLNPKQKQFAIEYPVDFNATKAAIRAGYSEKTAQEQGSRLLSNVMVQEIVQKTVAEKAVMAGLSVEWVLDKYKKLVERCMQVVPVREKIDGEWVDTGEFKFDSAGACKALDSLAKYLGMFMDRGLGDGEEAQEAANQIPAAEQEAKNRLQRMGALH